MENEESETLESEESETGLVSLMDLPCIPNMKLVDTKFRELLKFRKVIKSKEK